MLSALRRCLEEHAVVNVVLGNGLEGECMVNVVLGNGLKRVNVVNVVLVLLVFDFFYYLTHRFVFHGKLLFRVHALHHKALTPTYIDAHYVHPLETFIGLVLFLGSIPLVALLIGSPLNAVSVAVATLVFTQVNTLNHTYVNLPRFPFKTVDRITSLHAAHHVDMQQGNYATLTMLYDWAFGTLEKPVSRTSA